MASAALQKHRVTMPETGSIQRRARQSLAFFAHPLNDYLVECLDGSNKYEPVTGFGYIKMRFSVTY